MEIVLKAVDIEKTYGEGEFRVDALRGINLEIENGIFYAVTGRSGSGKSTLLHILGGLDKPTKGSLFLEGRNMSELKDSELARVRRRRIGFVFQSFNLLEEHTVLENILLPVDLDKRKPDAAYVERVVGALGLKEKLSSYPDELSGGQRQRAAIARALVPKPAVILADEPTGNLDEKTGKEVITLLKQSAERFHQTIVMVTHDMEAAREADKVIVIADGEITSVTENTLWFHNRTGP